MLPGVAPSIGGGPLARGWLLASTTTVPRGSAKTCKSRITSSIQARDASPAQRSAARRRRRGARRDSASGSKRGRSTVFLRFPNLLVTMEYILRRGRCKNDCRSEPRMTTPVQAAGTQRRQPAVMRPRPPHGVLDAMHHASTRPLLPLNSARRAAYLLPYTPPPTPRPHPKPREIPTA